MPSRLRLLVSALVGLATSLLTGCSIPAITTALPPSAPVASPSFRQAMGGLMSFGFVGGNRIETLENGDGIFPPMLEAIRGAKHTVCFENFLFHSGQIPDQFVEAMIERARAGVRVNLILDAVGSAKARPYHQRLKDAGVHLSIYHSLWSIDIRRANYRTHRKLLIVDGRIGFIGGVCIGDDWAGDARNPKEWRELHYRVQGPVVAQLQGAFHENWRRTGGEVLHGPTYFPPLQNKGNAEASVVYSSPRHARTQMELLFHLSAASAQRTLDITNAYFLPDNALTDALVAAAKRGVRVRIIVPGKNMDQPTVQRASRRRFSILASAGVEIYEYQPTMIHTKLLIADGLFVTLGSANFDPRSLRINDEANLNVLNRAFAAEQTRVFEKDLRQSKRVYGELKLRDLVTLPVSLLELPLESQL